MARNPFNIKERALQALYLLPFVLAVFLIFQFLKC
jgi:hypothetical protein